MRALDSLIIKCADLHKVPAGWALAVDREAFSEESLLELAPFLLLKSLLKK